MSKPKPRSKAGIGTAKGKVFERKAALALSTWWGDPEGSPHTARSFRRSPGSGGIDPHEWPGDIIPTRCFAHLWPLVIECKARDSELGDLFELLTAPKHALFNWIAQVRSDAEGVGRWWWLLVHRVHYPTFLIQDWRTWKRLVGAMREPAEVGPHFRFFRQGDGATFAICQFQLFLDAITPGALCDALPIREAKVEPRR